MKSKIKSKVILILPGLESTLDKSQEKKFVVEDSQLQFKIYHQCLSKEAVKDVQLEKRVLVSGLVESITDDSLKRYLMRAKKSGGGPVSEVQRCDASTAIVTFETIKGKTVIRICISIS